MKKMDWKKILVLIAIVALIAVLLFFLVKKEDDKEVKASEEETKIAENIIEEYLLSLTEGYNTPYSGIDVLYSKDKTTFEDLSAGNIIRAAINYANLNNLDTSVSGNIIENIKDTYDMNEYSPYNAKAIRQAIKELFGKDFNGSSIDEPNYLYNYFYVEEYDIYLSGKNDNTVELDTNHSMNYRIIETTKIKDTLKTKVAIAYIYDNNGKLVFTSDSTGNNIVFENEDNNYDIPDEEVSKFTQYTITLKKSDDKYVFDNIRKEN